MTCALLEIDHDRGQPTMDLPPVVAVGLRIHRRREQRVGKPDAVTVQLDQLGVQAAPQPGKWVLPHRFGDEPDRRLRRRRGEQQRLLGASRKNREPCPKKLTKSPAHGERLTWIELTTVLL
jgi:hypothetical protein